MPIFAIRTCLFGQPQIGAASPVPQIRCLKLFLQQVLRLVTVGQKDSTEAYSADLSFWKNDPGPRQTGSGHITALCAALWSESSLQNVSFLSAVHE